MLLFITLLVQLAGSQPPVGVAIVTRTGELCLAMPAPVSTGARITLVETDDSPQRVTAAIGRRVPTCEQLERALIPGPYYLIERPSPRLERGNILVALPGEISNGVQVRSCSSSEGLHLTLWSGQPLSSRRLWHAYYYLGFDVEPSCKDVDMRD